MEITADTLANLVIHYDMETCRRCGGEGRLWQHSNVDGGTCYSCGGRKRTRTAAAEKTREVFLAAQAELMTVPVADVRDGDRVEISGRWRIVESYEFRASESRVGAGARAITCYETITLRFVSSDRQRRTGDGCHEFAVGAFTVKRYSREAQVEALRRVAGMRGVRVERKEEQTASPLASLT